MELANMKTMQATVTFNCDRFVLGMTLRNILKARDVSHKVIDAISREVEHVPEYYDYITTLSQRVPVVRKRRSR